MGGGGGVVGEGVWWVKLLNTSKRCEIIIIITTIKIRIKTNVNINKYMIMGFFDYYRCL